MKGVTAIPLEEDRARTALSALAARNEINRRVSLLPSESVQKDDTIDDVAPTGPEERPGADGTRSPRVKFADEDDVKVVSPRPDQGFDAAEDERPPSPSSSTASTPSSVQSTNAETVAKTLAERLSFWSRLSKRSSRQTSIDHALMEQPGTEDDDSVLDSSIAKDDTKDPEEVINSIIASAAPPPQTAEEKHSELEEKIIRECVREYTRGGMYFAYTFGKQCTTTY